MDTQRLILWLIFSFSGLLLWQAWERERNPVPVPAASAPAPRSAVSAAAIRGTRAATIPRRKRVRDVRSTTFRSTALRDTPEPIPAWTRNA